ncbi:MAG TPA: LysR family transcriptional regulator [Bordetella sp.]|uniref:LysR family transcriptional regulator n=1 Tax=Bordetella sp. TaxID=28081 RepID=UPI002ED09495
MDNRLDLNLLLTLETLLAERSVTRAAAKLRSSQPAVSAQLARLRRMFDDPLLIPGARAMTPTPRALGIAPRLSELVDGFRAIVQREDFDLSTVQAVVMISASDVVQCRIGKWFATMADAAPGLQLGFVPGTRAMIPALDSHMASGQVDLLVGCSALIHHDRLHMRQLYREHLVCVMRRDHPFGGNTLGAEEFSSMKHLIVSPMGGDFSGVDGGVLHKLNLSRRGTVSVPSFLAAEKILCDTDLVSVFPATLARERAEALKSYPLPIAVPTIEIGMAWHERTHHSPLHRWMREQIANVLTEWTTGTPAA